ncbi:hypothetical protein SprV_0501938600 [Sparganum proliferum]
MTVPATMTTALRPGGGCVRAFDASCEGQLGLINFSEFGKKQKLVVTSVDVGGILWIKILSGTDKPFKIAHGDTSDVVSTDSLKVVYSKPLSPAPNRSTFYTRHGASCDFPASTYAS